MQPTASKELLMTLSARAICHEKLKKKYKTAAQAICQHIKIMLAIFLICGLESGVVVKAFSFRVSKKD
jgi:hypothetical protein